MFEAGRLNRLKCPWRGLFSALTLLALCAGGFAVPSARAQSPADWLTGLQGQGTPKADAPAENAAGAEQSNEAVNVQLQARLTADGEEIEEGLVWRIYGHANGHEGKTSLIATKQDARPTFKLKTGDYIVNAAFGRAHITRRISVKADGAKEEFVLNAGGLRIKALVSGTDAPHNSVSYAVYSDRDQTDNRKLVLSAAKPNLILRLNAGIYHIVSTYGDCNAVVRSDVTVEAGKLTEAVVTHSAAKATLKLVHRAGGEALPDTQWTIQTPQGEEVKESVGALPTHILAPGSYTVIAKSQGRVFQREITLTNGETTQVELVMN
ncbi:hypothetical protein [Hyphomicrobium sp. LHD-15]|uniref:hypothetical protein n=1 Tax=Hyphomicrobium sp. LHD-15 TaxID=3072142 RepID=UPI00280D4193|nr:hypothetical protein [Hyphomicrobium sp. LHD-15]MDQ8697286.1 hypothetical protein [Hyphomicrobium sp. LHD-15]